MNENPTIHFKNAKIVGTNIDPDNYHRPSGRRGQHDFVMSRSELMEFDHCPARWLHGSPTTETEATEWGSMMDCRVLSGDFHRKYCIKPNTYHDEKTGEEKPWNGNSKVCKQWLSDHDGLIPINDDELDRAERAEKRIAEDDQISELIGCSTKQVMVVGEYHDGNDVLVPVKVLLDMVPNAASPSFGKSLADFKTVRDASQIAFAKKVFDFNWHVQAAFYMDLYIAATREDRTDWLLAIQENQAPFQTARRLLSIEYVDLGRYRYAMAFRRYAECLRTGCWPDYETENTINGWSLTEPSAWMIGL